VSSDSPLRPDLFGAVRIVFVRQNEVEAFGRLAFVMDGDLEFVSGFRWGGKGTMSLPDGVSNFAGDLLTVNAWMVRPTESNAILAVPSRRIESECVTSPRTFSVRHRSAAQSWNAADRSRGFARRVRRRGVCKAMTKIASNAGEWTNIADGLRWTMCEKVHLIILLRSCESCVPAWQVRGCSREGLRGDQQVIRFKSEFANKLIFAFGEGRGKRGQNADFRQDERPINFEDAPPGLGLHSHRYAREFTDDGKFIASARDGEEGALRLPMRESAHRPRAANRETFWQKSEFEVAGGDGHCELEETPDKARHPPRWKCR